MPEEACKSPAEQYIQGLNYIITMIWVFKKFWLFWGLGFLFVFFFIAKCYSVLAPPADICPGGFSFTWTQQQWSHNLQMRLEHI